MDKQAWQEKLQAVQEFDFSELDLENVGSWPAPVKYITCLLLFLGCLFAGYKLDTEDLQKMLETSEKKEATLKQEYETKAFKVANLPKLRAQMKEMEETFGTLLKQLPTDTEVPGLLDDISKRGEDARLKFDSIKLMTEVAREFYIELPIQIKVQGTYHDMGGFVSGVASLPRIVTLHDFKIVPNGKSAAGLSMDIIARTYRYKEED